MRSSIAFIAVFSRPTSVPGEMSPMRWLKSPAAIDIAVSSTCPRLRKARVTSQRVARAPAMIVSSARNM
jgi:hypothetical protein